MLNLAAPIVPGRSVAGFSIGQQFCTLVEKGASRITLRDGTERIDFGAVQIWIRDGVIVQIGVGYGYTGKVFEQFGIGSTLSQVESMCGPVSKDDEDNLIVAGSDGWCFETEEWTQGSKPGQNPDVRITGIYVFMEP